MDFTLLAHVFPDTATVTPKGHLEIGGCNVEDLVAEHWQRTFSRNAAPARAAPLEQVLACCVATQLSARTGEPERPEAILTMEDWSL